MAFNHENYRRIREEYEGKYRRAEEEAALRAEQLHREIPALAAIDRTLSRTGLEIMQAAIDGKSIDDIKERNLPLLSKRAELLRLAGYPADYTEPKYECTKCNDSGYCGTRMCSCMRQKLIAATYASSGIANLMKTQTFDSFSLEYFKYDNETYERMKKALSMMVEYAEHFSAGENGQKPSDSLTLCGETGLGKTHLSTAVAAAVIEKGFDVLYTSAVELCNDFEEQHFRNREGADLTSKYFGCDLLIIDDLGAEMSTQFTVSSLYSLLNVRINRALPTIVSTNLSGKELRDRYSDRIASRLSGEFRPIVFCGEDVRKKRIRPRT